MLSSTTGAPNVCGIPSSKFSVPGQKRNSRPKSEIQKSNPANGMAVSLPVKSAGPVRPGQPVMVGPVCGMAYGQKPVVGAGRFIAGFPAWRIRRSRSYLETIRDFPPPLFCVADFENPGVRDVFASRALQVVAPVGGLGFGASDRMIFVVAVTPTAASKLQRGQCEPRNHFGSRAAGKHPRSAG